MALLATAVGAQAAETIGRVLVAVGEVSAVRGGREIRLQTTSSIEAGDRVRTGASSNAQIRLTDESIVALRPETEFVFTEYRYAGKDDGSERAFFRLLKGGLRTITGFVGRRNHQNYGIETATATIGIRGTHYVLMLCEQNCLNADGSRAADGLYGNATGFSFGTNRVSATNKTGETVFGVNQPFHVPDINTEPRRLIAPPDFLADRLPGRDRNQAKGPGNEGVQNAAGGNSDGRAAAALPPPGALPEIATEERDATGQLAVLETPLPGVGNGGVTYMVNVSSSFSQALVNASLTADAQGHLASFNDGQVTGASSGSATDVGSNSAAGNLHWGTWPTANVNGSAVTNLHYIVGDAPSLPNTGIFDYSPVGGTRPTNGAGMTGSFVGGTVRVDFTPGTLQLNNWAVAFNNATYTQSGAAGASFGRSPAFGNQMSWTCTGSSCAQTGGTVSGNFAGSFTGAGATGVGIVYGVFDTGTNGQIIGAQGFKR
jgi:hypothetical protein